MDFVFVTVESSIATGEIAFETVKLWIATQEIAFVTVEKPSAKEIFTSHECWTMAVHQTEQLLDGEEHWL